MDAADARQGSETLIAALGREGFARESIEVREAPGPARTKVVTAVSKGAYPGTGVKSAIVDQDAWYGADFPAQLGALAAARGWFAAPPDADTLASLVNHAHFGGLLQIDSQAEAPLVSRDAGGLVVTLVRRAMPSGARERLRVRLAPSGGDSISFESADPPAPAPPVPIDHVTALVRALAAGAPTTILPALRAMPEPATAREWEALAAAASHANDVVVSTALLKIGDGAGAARALKSSLAALTPARRAAILEIVRDTHGAPFAAGLE